ncbi:hypothetical protein [Streptomyces sp. NPDC095602]|uniref:hypothetical protein n=1 Tax=Streptomyces sp. NPDC095602 TaxID=3155819 RepID=UPI0033334CDB
MQTYTFICEWSDYMADLLDGRFVVVAEGADYREAEHKAAEMVLDHYASREIAETPESFWGGESGAVHVVDFYGDVSADLVDRDLYEIIRERSTQNGTGI